MQPKPSSTLKNERPRNLPFQGWSEEAAWLEGQLLPQELWCRAPTQAQDVAEKLVAQHISAGIAHHPLLGWCVVATQGQGPVFAYHERDYNPFDHISFD